MGERCPQANVEIQVELCTAQKLVPAHSTPLNLPESSTRGSSGPQLLASLIACPSNYVGDSLCREEGVGVILIDCETVQGLQGDWSSPGGIDVRVRKHLTRPLTCQQIPSSPQAAIPEPSLV